MKHNFMTKMVSALLAVVLSTAAFSVTAFASGGEESTGRSHSKRKIFPLAVYRRGTGNAGA